VRYDIVDLKLLVAISEVGNLTSAAAKCHMSTSSASIRLKNLEDVMGIPLFIRHARGLSTTSAGVAMVGHARNCLESLSKMHTEVSSHSRGNSKPIKFYANCTSIASTLVDDIEPFLSQNRGVRIQLEEHQSTEVVSSIKDGIADIGIVISKFADNKLINLNYRVEQLVYIAPESLKQSLPSIISFTEASKHPLISTDAKSAMHNYLLQKAIESNIVLDIRIHVSNYYSAARLVQQGVGCAIVPEACLFGSLQRGIVAIKMTDDWAKRQLVICYSHESSHINPQVSELGSHLSQYGQKADHE
jgi:DNA-binding transcriptional LysR family regulator